MSAGALAGKTPAAILTLTARAADAQSGVHYQLEAVQGSEEETVTGDAGQDEGEQQRTVGSSQVQVELVGGTAYFAANAAGLEQTFGVPTSSAPQYAGTWVSVSSSDSLYRSLADSVVLATVVGQILPTGALDLLGSTTAERQPVVAVRGGLPGEVQPGVTGSAILYVDTRRPDLPVAFSGRASNGTQHVVDSGVFDGWGERLELSAPASAVSYSSLPTS